MIWLHVYCEENGILMRIVVIKDLKTGLYWKPYGSLDEWVNNPLEASDRSSYVYYEDANLFYKDDNYKLAVS